MRQKILDAIVGKYDLWRIFSVETERCAEPDGAFRIDEISDLGIFQEVGLDESLRRSNWHRPGAMGFKAMDGDELAGVCWFWPGPLLGGRNVGRQPEDCAELIQVTVGEINRGKGLAQRLIVYGAWRMKEMGYRRLLAQVWHSNESSIRAFQKAGWEQVGWFCQIQPRWLGVRVCYRGRDPHLFSSAAPIEFEKLEKGA